MVPLLETRQKQPADGGAQEEKAAMPMPKMGSEVSKNGGFKKSRLA